MRLTGSRAYYRPSPPKMPPGLIELMEGLSKEVLKHNPSDVYGFCAGHMQQLLEKRDGPTVKKSISLEEKICRAQEKVRKRAEKRRQEYDKNMILLQQSSNVKDCDVKDGTNATLQLPQTSADQKSINTSGGDTILSVPNPLIQHVIKAPVHQELALESSSEVEISQESGVDVNTPRDIFSADDTDHDVGNDDIKLNESSDHDVTTEISTKLPENLYITTTGSNDENKIQGGVAVTNIPDTETANKLETDKIPDKTSDVSSETTIIETTNRLESNKSPENTSIISSETAVPAIETINKLESNNTSDTSPEIETPKLDENVKYDQGIHCETIEPAVTIPPANNLATDSGQNISKLEENEDKKLDQQEKNEDSEHPRSVEDIQTLKNTDETNSDLIIIPQPTNDLEQKIDSNAESTIVKYDSLTNNHDPSLINDPVSEIIVVTEPVNNSDNINLQNTEDVHLNSITELHKHEIIDQAKSEELPAAGGDNDIITLMTDESVDDTNIDDVNNSLEPLDNMSQVDKDNLVKAILESETLNDEIHPSTEKSDGGENIQNQNDNNSGRNMDLETAAVTIQKVFRNFLFKSRSSTEDTCTEEGTFLDEGDKDKEECDFPIASALNIDRRPHGITRMDTVLQTVNEEKSLSLSDDSSTLSSAATIIQAHVRGFLVRNRLNSNKTVSTNSLAASNSNEPSITSLEADNEHNRNKTVLNIHIVPEGGENYLSRDESLITSMELSLDSSPPSSINLHPLGYDKSERRKQLKREDAIQSISPPSNNSGKLSEDLESVKELSLNDHDASDELIASNPINDGFDQKRNIENGSLEHLLKPAEKAQDSFVSKIDDTDAHIKNKRKSLTKMSSDEMDVVSPYISNEDSTSSKLLHSGEFHDAVLPTRLSRSDTSVVSGE